MDLINNERDMTMFEKIIEEMETRIEEQIKSILKKDFIDNNDYQILVGEINRLKAKEKEEKYEEEKKKRDEAMKLAMNNIFSPY